MLAAVEVPGLRTDQIAQETGAALHLALVLRSPALLLAQLHPSSCVDDLLELYLHHAPVGADGVIPVSPSMHANPWIYYCKLLQLYIHVYHLLLYYYSAVEYLQLF